VPCHKDLKNFIGARDPENPNRTRIGSEPWAKLVSTILAADTGRSETSDHEREA
jgi:hypothetical protein